MAKNWNFGRPRAGAPLVRRERLAVRLGGKDWHGHWEVEGEKLHVSSAYGGRSEPIGKTKDLAGRAQALFAEILERRPNTNASTAHGRT